MVNCSVPYCSSYSQKSSIKSLQEGGEYVSYHEFPCDLNLEAQWLKAISRKDFVVNRNSSSSRVCSKHFREEDFLPFKNGRRLKAGSVPTVFPDYPKYMQTSASSSTPRKPPKRRLESLDKAELHLVKRTTPSIRDCSNNSIDFDEFVFPQILKFYPDSEIESYSTDKVVLRMNLGDGEEAETFVKFYSSVSNTNWIVIKTVSSPQRLVFSKLWVCQHSSKNKKADSKRNVSCKSHLKIIIKKVNRSTKKNDSFLSLCPPLSTEVTISLEHSHSTISEEALKMLRVNDEVKEQFFDYFNEGKTPAEAILYHENKLLEKKDLKNASVNPTHRQVYHIYKCWKILNLGQTEGSSNHMKKEIQLSNAAPVIKAEKQDLETFSGQTGTSCKYMKKQIQESNAPPVIKAEKEVFPPGSACPSISVFEETSLSSDMQWEEETPPLSDTETLPSNSEETVKLASAAQKEELQREWMRISKMILESNMGKDEATALLNTLKSIKTVDDLLRVFKPSPPKRRRVNVQLTTYAAALLKRSKKQKQILSHHIQSRAT